MGQESSNRWRLLTQFSVKVLFFIFNKRITKKISCQNASAQKHEYNFKNYLLSLQFFFCIYLDLSLSCRMVSLASKRITAVGEPMSLMKESACSESIGKPSIKKPYKTWKVYILESRIWKTESTNCLLIITIDGRYWHQKALKDW